MIEIIPTGKDSVLAIAAHGTVTGEDYEKVIVPLIEERLKVHGKIRFLYLLGEDFTGYTPSAVWDDAKLGFRHLNGFEKVAVVTNEAWVTNAVKFFRFIVPCPVKVFGNDKLAEAKIWVNG